MNLHAYAQKLKSPKWQKKRLEVLQRAGFACECCKDTEETLHVHHLIYHKEDPWDIPDNHLECLCETCHANREDFNEKWGRGLMPTKVCLDFQDYFGSCFDGKEECFRTIISLQDFISRVNRHLSKSSTKQPDQTTAPAVERPRDVHANSGHGQCAPPDRVEPCNAGNPGERKTDTASLSGPNQPGETLARSHTPSTFAAPPPAPETAETGCLCQSPNNRPN